MKRSKEENFKPTLIEKCKQFLMVDCDKAYLKTDEEKVLIKPSVETTIILILMIIESVGQLCSVNATRTKIGNQYVLHS